MREFSDEENRKWQIKFTAPVFERIKASVGFDLTDIFAEPDMMERIRNSDLLLVNLLWTLCERQAQTNGITPEHFAEALYGEAIDRAEGAFWGALMDFFPKRRREALDKALAAMRMVEAERVNMLSEVTSGEILQRLIEQDKEAMRTELAKLGRPNGQPQDPPGERIGSLPAFSASTLDT